MSIDDLVTALGEAGVLDLLGMTYEELLAAHSDAHLVETLRIIYDLMLELRDSHTLGTLLRLPRSDQENFLRWIGSTDDETLRTTRTETFISALRMSPLGAGEVHRSEGL